MVSLYFVPWANSSLIHLQATLLSPHSCIVGLSPRVNDVVPRTQTSGRLFHELVVSIFLFYFLVFRGDHLCFHPVRFSGSSFIILVLGIPPSRTPQLMHFLQRINHRIPFFIAGPPWRATYFPILVRTGKKISSSPKLFLWP